MKFSTSSIKAGKIKITADDVLSRVTQEELFIYYLDRDPNEYGLMTNPLRQDKNPGCSFFTNPNSGRIYFNDFAADIKYDIFDVIKEKFDINYRQALIRIDEDFKLGIINGKPCKERQEVLPAPKPKKIIQVIQKDWEQWELDYWLQYGITQSTLELFNVFPVKEVYVNKKLKFTTSKDNPIFCYYFPKTKNVKIYMPLSPTKKDKWRSSCTIKDIQGNDQLPFTGDLLLITSSLKDAMCLYELGYSAIAPQQEGTSLSVSYVDSLKDTFKRVVLFFDNDGTFYPDKGQSGKGKEATKKASKKYDIPYIFTGSDAYKDISDYYKQYGKEKTIELLTKILKT